MCETDEAGEALVSGEVDGKMFIPVYPDGQTVSIEPDRPHTEFAFKNMFYELPKPDEIYDYERYTSPNYILEDNSSIVEQELDDITELDNSNSNFNFALE